MCEFSESNKSTTGKHLVSFVGSKRSKVDRLFSNITLFITRLACVLFIKLPFLLYVLSSVSSFSRVIMEVSPFPSLK